MKASAKRRIEKQAKRLSRSIRKSCKLNLESALLSKGVKMESHATVTDLLARIPPIIWFLGVGLIVALAAIIIFNVTVNTVMYYGFFALMIGGHLFMHGGHGSHAGHQSGAESNPSEADDDKNEHAGHSGGCH